MFLSDQDVRVAVKSGDIEISDFDESRLQQASYDIRLGNKFLLVKSNSTLYIDPEKGVFPEYTEKVIEDGESFVIHPGGTVLGVSRERFGSKDYLIQLSGKSSLARLGLIVHNTAGIINPGHFLNITFELANLNKVPIVLRPGMEIAQILFARMSSTPDRDYTMTGRFGEGDDNFTSHIKK